MSAIERMIRTWRRRVVPPVEVERAIALDGVHLWITLHAPGPGNVLAIATADEHVTVFAEPVSKGRGTVVLDPAVLPGSGEATFELFYRCAESLRPLRRSRRTGSSTRALCSPDGFWKYCFETGPATLELHRRRGTAVQPVAYIAQQGSAVCIGWSGAAEGDVILVDQENREVASGPIVDLPNLDYVGVWLTAELFVPSAIEFSVMVRAGEDVVPLGRSRNDLMRPNAAVLLPMAEADNGSLALQWSSDGLLRAMWRPAE